jgi:Tol biopolymer transport system component
VSPDGTRIAYLGYDDTRRSNQNALLYVMNRDGSGTRAILPNLDRSIDSVAWGRDGRSLYVSYDDQARKKVARVTLDGRMTMLTDALSGGASMDRPYTGGSFTVSDGGALAYSGGHRYPTRRRLPRRPPATRLNETALAQDVWAPTASARR